MSMISEQVKELRELANSKEFEPHEPVTYGFYARIKSKLFKAADTIEALSAKLQAANMERSAEDCGRWIYCGDGNNLPEIERDILLSTRSLDVYKGYRSNREGYFYAEGEGYILYENVLAWMPQPEPYHEP